jgi:predicted phosphodiesterase
MPRIAVCGGVYSNPYALRAFAADARARGAQRLWCLGDLGGYGAEPEEIWGLLREFGIECIAGNYEVAIGRGDPDCGCGYRDPIDNQYAQLMYDYTRAHTSQAYASWMRTLPTERRERIDGVDVHLVHGSPLQLNDFWWESLTDAEHEDRIRASGASVICCTHSGIGWIRRIGGTLVVNAGVLGRPANDGRREVWYAILDINDTSADAALVPLAYDWQAHAASMRRAGLPEAFTETIETGWWTTCLEIVPPRERSRGRFQLYRSALPTGFGSEAVSWADEPQSAAGGATTPSGRPVVELFGSALFPPRLWLYTNFHCNLHCWYCSVASQPRARPRELGPERFRQLVDEAIAEGFTELYVTGGEPFLLPYIVELLEYASDRIATVALTNGMLYRGRRRDELARLAGRPNLILQTSIDGARPATHDRNRGKGSWARAMAGLEFARSLGLPVRVGMTETEENSAEVPELRDLLAGHGITGADFAVRPLVRRGLSESGVQISDANTVPELAVTQDGWHWHPAGADVGTSPDMFLAPATAPMAEGKRRAIERFLALRQSDGTLPRIYNCAV